MIQSYCFGCHNSKAKVGGLALDSMSPDRIAEDASDVGSRDTQAARWSHAAARREASGETVGGRN